MTAKKMIELLQQHHPHIGETEALELLNQAKDEFCEDTGIYTSQTFTVTTTAGTILYGFEPDTNIRKIIASKSRQELMMIAGKGKIRIDSGEANQIEKDIFQMIQEDLV